jgi:hypothetical protein
MTNTTQSFKGQLGGARPGAGRPKGSKSTISSKSLLAQVELDANGRSYEELLVDDFMSARRSGDAQLIYKYHTLILSKVMSTLSKVEVEDSTDAIAAKQLAFSTALSKLTGIPE